MKERFKNYFAEFLGTMLLVLFGCGTAMAVGTSAKQGSGYLITALAFGLCFIALAYSICKRSGCHVNPAVSLAMLVLGKIKVWDFIGYVIAQFAGSFAACGLLTAIFYGHTGRYFANTFYDANPWISLLIEIILTFVLVSVFISTSTQEQYSKLSGVLTGLCLTLVNLFGIQLTGASVNPARSLATAVFAGETALSECWVFIVAPLIGAVLAALVYKLLMLPSTSASKTEELPQNEEMHTENEVETRENKDSDVE